MNHLDNRVQVVVVDDPYLARGLLRGPRAHVGALRAGGVLFHGRSGGGLVPGSPDDLVIIDVMMKCGPDGITRARTIRANDPQAKIILTTSAAEAEWIDKARRAKVESSWWKE